MDNQQQHHPNEPGKWLLRVASVITLSIVIPTLITFTALSYLGYRYLFEPVKEINTPVSLGDECP